MTSVEASSVVRITINGRLHEIKPGDVLVHTSLLEYLRYTANLKGTKAGCLMGGCGACTVMVSVPSLRGVIDHKAINACMTPLLTLDGASVTTVEGVGDAKQPHAVQRRIAKCHGTQCGFCTPGMTMSLYTHLMNNTHSTTLDLENVFEGNLCRCTGYRPLLDAAKSFVADIEDAANTVSIQDRADPAPLSTRGMEWVVNDTMSTIHDVKDAVRFDPSREIASITCDSPVTAALVHTDRDDNVWIQPRSMEQVRELMREFPQAEFVAGNPGFRKILEQRTTLQGPPKQLMFTGYVKEMQYLTLSDQLECAVGASLTLSQFQRDLTRQLKVSPGLQKDLWTVAALSELITAVGKVGTPQTRGASTLIGHVLTRPCGDLTPLLAAMQARILILGSQGNRYVDVSDICGPSRFLCHGEIVSELLIPPQTNRFVATTGARMRKDNSHNTCTVAMTCTVARRETDVFIKNVLIYCSGIGYYLSDFPDSVQVLEGISVKDNYEGLLRSAADQMIHVLKNAQHPPAEGKVSYRISVARGCLYRLFARLQQSLDVPVFDESILKATASHSCTGVSKASQSWEMTQGGLHDRNHTITHDQENPYREPVGDPVVCITAIQQTTGQAVYVDDIPTPAGCLFASLVKSTVAKGVIRKVDHVKAAAIDGFVQFFDYNDIPVKPSSKPTKEHAFCLDEVRYIGDVIGVVVATTQIIADRCAKLVEVTYDEPSVPPVYSIDEAIEDHRFYEYGKQICCGSSAAMLADSQLQKLSGVFYQGGQEHFYLEPHALLVQPGENDDIEIFSMTQCVTKTQNCVASLLGIPASKVNVKVKRIGGAFGGKEVRSTYTAGTLAVAAVRLKRPIRWLIDREEDMRITGGRHPYRADWRVAVDPTTKKIMAMDVSMYSNGGCTDSATSEVMTRSLMHITNAYHIPNVTVRGYLCETNIVSNTAFRGFGAPQAMLVMENIIEAVACKYKCQIESIQQSHLLPPNGVTHYGQKVVGCRLEEMFHRLMQTAQVTNRKLEIHTFNSSSRYVKRGLALVPTMYGINFPVKHLNQGGAFVCLYTDGSVSVAHSAVEMGQGLNTKCAQVAARALGVPLNVVHISDAASDKTPNTPPTAASMGSDLTCMAILDACETLRERLAPLKEKNPTKSFGQLCDMAFKNRISLSAVGFYRTSKGSEYDWKLQTDHNEERGPAFNYHVFGMGASEVEIDVITGQFRVLRADLLMDCGETLNPAIDVGQIEGSFLQGLGWLTMEELLIGGTSHAAAGESSDVPDIPNGVLYNANPHMYKIPGASDVPLDCRIELLGGAENPFAVHGSKAVGEPPLFLAASVFFALKQAIYSARREAGLFGYAQLDAPLTAERIRMACRDEFTVGTYRGEEFVAHGSF